MAAGTQTGRVVDADSTTDSAPDISVCESCPGKAVFLESDNTDGWIASDLTVEVPR